VGRTIPLGDIPDVQLVPDGIYEAEIESFEETVSSTEKLMFKVTHRVIGPSSSGAVVFNNIVVGTDDDKMADDPETWKRMGGTRLRRFFKALGFDVSGAYDSDELGQAAIGQHALISVGRHKSDRGGEFNDVTGYFALGEREVGVTGPSDNHKPAAPARVTRPAPAAARPRPAAVTKPSPAARPGPRPSAPKAGAHMLCTYCNTQVPRAEYPAHVEGHEAELGTGEE
jgi:hypothetical protein